MALDKDTAASADLEPPAGAGEQPGGADGRQQKGGFPSDETVARVLRDAGIAGSAQELKLEPIPRNPERRDYLTRKAFRVFSGSRGVCHLSVGRGLGDLRSRIQAFAEACPGIACRPLFWRQFDDWDYHGIELSGGRDLETLVAEGRMTSADAFAHARAVVSALDRTLAPSDAGAASQEMERFLSRACASPIFSGLDQQFLRDVIFPFIRRGASAGPQQTRWTNGDLIARNVLVDEQGAVRLVDYEFAARTHFFAEDWWRWHSLSALPPDALDLPGAHHAAAHDPWLEAFFILRHVVLVHETNGVSVAVSGLRGQMDRLVALAAAAHRGFRASVFFQPLVSPRPAQGGVTAQLLQDANPACPGGNFQRREYRQDENATVDFILPSAQGRLNLCLGPAGVPGIVTIFAIRVCRQEGGPPLLALDEKTGWDALRVENGLLRLAGSPALNLLGMDNDPRLLLPGIDVGDSPCNLVCEVRLRFSPRLTALPHLIPSLASAAGLADRLRQCQEKISRMQQSFSWRVTAPLRWLRRRFLDRRSRTNIGEHRQ